MPMVRRVPRTGAVALLFSVLLVGCSSTTDPQPAATNPATSPAAAPSNTPAVTATAGAAAARQDITTKRGYPLQVTLFPIETVSELGDPGYTKIRYAVTALVKNKLTDRPTPLWSYGLIFYYDLTAVPFSAGPGATLGRGANCPIAYRDKQISGREYCGAGMTLSMGSGGPDAPLPAGAEVDGGLPSNIAVAWVVDDANLTAARTFLHRPKHWAFVVGSPNGESEEFLFPFPSP